MSDKMREEFEAWYCKKFTFENMARRADGTYRGEHAFNSWVSWQAALSQSKPVSQEAINIVADWPPCNPACEYEDPHGGLHDERSASCSCDAAKCSIAKQNLKSEPEVSQPVAEGYMVNDNGNGKHLFVNWFAKPVEGFLYSSPPDYEALKEQLIRSESDNTRLQDQYDEMRLKCSRLPVVAENEALKAKNKELKEDLQFVERWANHHAVKPSVSAKEALSCIQHYPSIFAITKSYKDGVMPTTRNPYDEIEALRQRVAELEAMVDQAQSYWDDILTKGESLKVENMRLQSECDRLRGHLAGWKAMAALAGEEK